MTKKNNKYLQMLKTVPTQKIKIDLIDFDVDNSNRLTLKKMWNCGPLSDELARIKKIKTMREFKRWERLKGIRPSDKL